MDGQRRLRAMAATQDGQFATAQAAAVGLTPAGLRTLRASGEVVQLRRSVWRFTVAPGIGDAAVTAYLSCWPVGVVCQASAARHHGLTRVPPPTQPEVAVPWGARRRPEGVRIWTTRRMSNVDVLRVGAVNGVGGVRYTTLARTVIDQAEQCEARQALAILDDAVALGAAPRWINQRATALASGRRGATLIRDATMPGAAAIFRSWLERTSATVFTAAGLPAPEWNVPVHDSDGLIGVVDALWRAFAVIAEFEGLRFHTSPVARRRDAHRFNRLCDAGYQVRRFTWHDLVADPAGVVATLTRTLAVAGADLDPSRIAKTIPLPPLTLSRPPR